MFEAIYHSQARKTYAEGARQGVFLSEWQRSSYNVDRLTGRPWWTAEQTKNEKFLKVYTNSTANYIHILCALYIS